MWSAVGPIVPLAVGVAISPLPIMAVILILFTPKARSNGPAFLLGWVVGLALVTTIVLVVFSPQDYSNSGPTKFASVVHLALGVLLLALGFRRWRNRPGPGETPTPPKWITKLGEFGPLQCFGIGAMLSGVNPKNTVLTLSAAVSIAQSELSAAETVLVVVIYILIASVTIAAPVCLLIFAPKKAEHILATWRAELLKHGLAVGVTLFTVFGALLVGKGIAGLA
jgi:threonine/homoserine/homoserine lactone efflux protein